LKRGLQHIFALFYQENQWNGNETGLASSSASFKAGGDGSEHGPSPAGEPPVITEVNMVNYLAVLEKKTNELMQTYRNVQQTLTAGFSHGPDSSTGPSSGTMVATTGKTTKGGVSIERQPLFITVLGSGPKVPMGQEHLHVNPPKADDLYKYDSSNNVSSNHGGGTSFGDDENGGTHAHGIGNGVDEEDEEETRPLTRDELKYRTLSRIQKRLTNTSSK
jgi:hypothetical protein